MRVLDLDFVQRKRSPWAGWALLGVAVLLGAEMVYSYTELERGSFERTAQSTSRTLTTKTSLSGSPRNGGGSALEGQAIEAAAVIERLTLPWPALFQALERVALDRVALLSIQPDPERRIVTLVGEAKQYEDVLAYIGSLNVVPVFRHVHLVSHEVKQDDPQRPVLFTVSASWKIGQ